MKMREMNRAVGGAGKMFPVFALAALAVFAVGCGNKEAGKSDGEAKVVHPADVQPGSEAEAPVIEQAPASQPAAAGESASVCPVSGEENGGHGDPIKVMVEGKEVTVCCEGCIEPLKADPKKYLTSL